MKHNGTIKTIALSLASVVLCLVMLLGATFAWFSSSVTTATNVIRTGTFEVDVEYSIGDFNDFAPLNNTVALFDNVVLSPGENTDIRYIKITNKNSYPVKVTVSVNNVQQSPADPELKFYYKEVTQVTRFDEMGDSSTLTGPVSHLSDKQLNKDEYVIIAVAFGLDVDATQTGEEIQFTVAVRADQIAPVNP